MGILFVKNNNLEYYAHRNIHIRKIIPLRELKKLLGYHLYKEISRDFIIHNISLI